MSRSSIALHWAVALGILFLLGIGIWMTNEEVWSLYELHKSVGVLVFGLVLARAWHRLRAGFPAPVRPLGPAEAAAAKGAHWLLLGGTVALPVTGLLYSAAGGYGVGVFGLALFPANPDSGAPEGVAPFNAALALSGQAAHHWLGWALACLVALHAAAALKHHFLDRDATLLRMLGVRDQASPRV